MERITFIFIIIILLVFIIFNCSTETTINLKKNGSGSAKVRLIIAEPFFDYYKDLMAVSKNPNSKSIFNLDSIKATFSVLKGLTLNEISCPSERELFLSFSFSNLANLLQDKKLSFLKEHLIYQAGPEPALYIKKINRSFVQNVLAIFFTDSTISYKDYLPSPNETAEHYYQTLNYLFDDADQLVKNSIFSLTINTEGQITKHNGKLNNPTSLTFSRSLDSIFFAEPQTNYYLFFK